MNYFMVLFIFAVPILNTGFASEIESETFDLNSLFTNDKLVENDESNNLDDSVNFDVVCKTIPSAIIHIKGEDVTIDCSTFKAEKEPRLDLNIVKREVTMQDEGSGDDSLDYKENTSENAPENAPQAENVTTTPKVEETTIKVEETTTKVEETTIKVEETTTVEEKPDEKVEIPAVSSPDNIQDVDQNPSDVASELGEAPKQDLDSKATAIEVTKTTEEKEIDLQGVQSGLPIQFSGFSQKDPSTSNEGGQRSVFGKSAETPKEGATTEISTKSAKDTKILIFLFVAVVTVGVAAFAYNFIKKRKENRAALARVENGEASPSKLTANASPNNVKEQEMKEMKPLMKEVNEKAEKDTNDEDDAANNRPTTSDNNNPEIKT